MKSNHPKYQYDGAKSGQLRLLKVVYDATDQKGHIIWKLRASINRTQNLHGTPPTFLAASSACARLT